MNQDAGSQQALNLQAHWSWTSQSPKELRDKLLLIIFLRWTVQLDSAHPEEERVWHKAMNTRRQWSLWAILEGCLLQSQSGQGAYPVLQSLYVANLKFQITSAWLQSPQCFHLLFFSQWIHMNNVELAYTCLESNVKICSLG